MDKKIEKVIEIFKDLSEKPARKQLIFALQNLQSAVDEVYNYFPQTLHTFFPSRLPLDNFTARLQDLLKHMCTLSPLKDPEGFLRDFQAIQMGISREQWTWKRLKKIWKIADNFPYALFPSNVLNLTEWVVLLVVFVRDEARLQQIKAYTELLKELVGIQDLFNLARAVKQKVQTIKDLYKSRFQSQLRNGC